MCIGPFQTPQLVPHVSKGQDPALVQCSRIYGLLRGGVGVTHREAWDFDAVHPGILFHETANRKSLRGT